MTRKNEKSPKKQLADVEGNKETFHAVLTGLLASPVPSRNPEAIISEAIEYALLTPQVFEKRRAAIEAEEEAAREKEEVLTESERAE